jgi:hypothetical protein
MRTMPGRPRGRTRLARALGLDGNPLRRASDRAEAWLRIGLLAVFLIAGPPARSSQMLAVVMTLALMALALLAALRLTLAFLTRRRLTAWEAAWSRVGPQWSGGRT